MLFERSFKINVGSEQVLRRLITGLPAMGYRQVGSDPLQFRRGSRLGRWLSASMKAFETTVTIKLTPLTIEKTTKVDVSLIVSQIPDDEWTKLGRKVLKLPGHQFWARELEMIEAAAGRANLSLIEQYDASTRTRANQDLIIICFAAVVICAAAAVVWFTGADFEFIGGPGTHYVLISLIAVFLVILITIIYNTRK